MKEKNPKKAFFWNMTGSSIYSGSSILYLMFVTRALGVEEAGFFSLCYATAQLLLTLGRFGMRTYQATDLNAKYSFSEYLLSRFFTCSAMLLGGLCYGLFCFQGDRVLACVLIVMMKMLDAVEDVFHGNLQQIYCVEVMGKLLAARNLYTVVVFTVSIYMTKALLPTLLMTVLSSLIVCIAINRWATLRCMKERGFVSGKIRLGEVFRLLGSCAALFAGTFLSLLLYNVPKYAMSASMADEYQAYYSILFMPSFVITLLCEFVFKPTITNIARAWHDGNLNKFRKYVLGIVGFILAADIAVILGGHFIGRRLLEIIYAVDLSSFKVEFIILLAGGGIASVVYMLYNILIAIRKGGSILPVYLVATVLTVIPVRKMVELWGVKGACLNFVLSSSILFVQFAVLAVWHYRKRKNALAES